MQVALVGSEGLPEGCLLSIRAGTTRRQAPVSQDQPFRFPRTLEKDTTFKIDVLSPLGSEKITVSAAEMQSKEARQYTVPMVGLDGGAVSLTLQVSSDPEEVETDLKKPSRVVDPLVDPTLIHGPSRRHLAALHARTYLDSHDLLQLDDHLKRPF